MNLRELLKLPPANRPVIAVPMTLGPQDKFSPFARELATQNPDVVEWRADYIVDEFSQEVIWQQVKAGAQQELAQKNVSKLTEAKMLSELESARQEFLTNWPAMQREIIKEIVSNVFDTVGQYPVILTYRTKSQGGQGEFNELEYVTFIMAALQTGFPFAAIDLEDTLESGLKEKIIQAAKAREIPVLLSYHDWQTTPVNLEKVIQYLADQPVQIVKLAVMPQVAADVDRLLNATAAMAPVISQPLVTMAMGPFGEKSRIEGYKYGSQMTFATLSSQYSSAPGQLTVAQLLQAWQ
ncbi:type I 3-dehydroquinate dehydratase [Convivina intestini]|uniref:3-dehydroquinate dehydratase n=1 Tax=Convivina intestini TaxID=1505726 RepID=A0A2U1DES1_9LACO|nr:type I 3-dehydroquinate dehydratase [Convivina intestini]PVY86178.1 3-dehydroquinate dehydratase [Convivina intestini]CAH1851393.1 3-dehydroquinate dehydratase [Convivina intestini]CAH1852866.1 3-dehydroquinate dehydratase [Convivina intestini]SDB81276.1 3-dehydroquinate dehydratase [Leuconostocaceae bacterium R-53105]